MVFRVFILICSKDLLQIAYENRQRFILSNAKSYRFKKFSFYLNTRKLVVLSFLVFLVSYFLMLYASIILCWFLGFFGSLVFSFLLLRWSSSPHFVNIMDKGASPPTKSSYVGYPYDGTQDILLFHHFKGANFLIRAYRPEHLLSYAEIFQIP